MTTNSPDPVEGDVQALIADCQTEIEDLKRSIDRCDAIGTSDYLHHLQSKLKRQYAALAALTAQPYAYASRKPKRNDHSKLAAEIVHNLVSTDSCDEEVTEKLILWVLNRLNKEFPTPPAQLLRPVGLPTGYTSGYSSLGSDERFIRKSEVIAALRQQGYEVKS